MVPWGGGTEEGVGRCMEVSTMGWGDRGRCMEVSTMMWGDRGLRKVYGGDCGGGGGEVCGG